MSTNRNIPISKLNLNPDEISIGMLLTQYEVHESLSKTLPELENFLHNNYVSNMDFDKNLMPLTLALLRQGIFCHSCFLDSFNFNVDNELDATNVWEASKQIRNLTVSLIIGLMIDSVLDRNLPTFFENVHRKTDVLFNRLFILIDDYQPNNISFVDTHYLGTVREITTQLNIILKQGLSDVIGCIQNITIEHPARALLLNLNHMILFGDKWQFIRRPGSIGGCHEFISRGIDSMTLVSYQCMQLITEVVGPPVDCIGLLNMYIKSFPLLALFASGDREIMGLVRRHMERPGEATFDPSFFAVSSGGGIRPTKEALSQVTEQVRRLIFSLMVSGSIWMRGLPRQVTYCPAIINRSKGHNTVIRDVFDLTVLLYSQLNTRHCGLGDIKE